DYGVPFEYPKEYQKDYILKAIPYSAVNTPSYGSEFSDPILTLMVTYFSLMKTGISRNLDKKFFLELKLANKYDKKEYNLSDLYKFVDARYIKIYEDTMIDDM